MSNIFFTIKWALAALQATLNQRFGIKSQKGVTIIEYALVAALIAIAAITMVGNVGNAINDVFDNINTQLAL